MHPITQIRCLITMKPYSYSTYKGLHLLYKRLTSMYSHKHTSWLRLLIFYYVLLSGYGVSRLSGVAEVCGFLLSNWALYKKIKKKRKRKKAHTEYKVVCSWHTRSETEQKGAPRTYTPCSLWSCYLVIISHPGWRGIRHREENKPSSGIYYGSQKTFSLSEEDHEGLRNRCCSGWTGELRRL